jgi:iron complex transport system permease protein
MRFRNIFFALLTLVITSLIAISFGPIHLPVASVIKTIFNLPGRLTGNERTVLLDIRAPRIILAILVGSALSASGAVYQTVFRNPLADPYLLGAASGAGLGATIALTNNATSGALPIFAFVGAVAAVFLSFFVSGKFFSDPNTLLLSGIAVGSFATAVQTYLQQRHSASLRPVYSWILGQLGTADWSTVRWSAIYILVALFIIFIVRKKLDALLLSDEEAFSLGINPNQLRIIALGAATFATATAVSASGLIGFVGIVIPHLVRGLTHRVSNSNLPVIALSGGAFLVIADLGARSILSPAELPIGVLTAFIGAPFFLFILRQRRVNGR